MALLPKAVPLELPACLSSSLQLVTLGHIGKDLHVDQIAVELVERCTHDLLGGAAGAIRDDEHLMR